MKDYNFVRLKSTIVTRIAIEFKNINLNTFSMFKKQFKIVKKGKK